MPPLAIYCSTQTHSSIDKAAIALGIGRQWTRHIETDVEFRMRPDLLERAITNDLTAGVKPIRDYGLSLGRRFRALKLWMVIRAYGRAGLSPIIEGHINEAQWLAQQIDATPGWERLAPVPFSTVCFRHVPTDGSDLAAHNAAIIERVNASGQAFLASTTLNGQYALRVAIGNFATTHEHVARVWELLQV